jgi:hypothetical protein
MMMSGLKVEGGQKYRRERAEAIRSKRIDILWIWRIYLFGDKFRIMAVIK